MRTSNNDWLAGWVSLPLLLLSAIFMTALYLSPQRQDETVGLVFKPGTGFAEAAFFVGEAGGRILEPGPSQNIVIARFEGGGASLPAAAPLWFRFSANASGSCLSASTRQRPSFSFAAPYPNEGDV